MGVGLGTKTDSGVEDVMMSDDVMSEDVTMSDNVISEDAMMLDDPTNDGKE